MNFDITSLISWYWVALTVGGGYILFSTLMGDIFDFNDSFDFSFDGFELPIRPTILLIFLAAFGGSGLIASIYLPETITLAVSILVGVVFAAMLHYLMNVVLKRIEAKAPKKEEALGTKATVIVSIPPDGIGKIEYNINRKILSNTAKEAIPKKGITQGTEVYIVKIEDGIFHVTVDLDLYTGT